MTPASASAGTATSRISRRSSACRWAHRANSASAAVAATNGERHALEALPRSLYLMDGEARSQWEHSIPPVEARRYSITFRTMKQA